MVIAAGTDYAIFLDRSISGGPRRGRGQGDRVLHDVSRHRSRRAGVRPDHRRRDAVPQLHAAAVLPDHGVPCAVGTLVAVLAALTLGPGGDRHRQPLRPLRTEARDPLPRLAPGRHRRGAVARPDPGRDDRARAGRSARPARATRPTTTTATSCPPTCPPTSATPSPTGTSTPPG